jgi:hypothetical protein
MGESLIKSGCVEMNEEGDKEMNGPTEVDETNGNRGNTSGVLVSQLERK